MIQSKSQLISIAQTYYTSKGATRKGAKGTKAPPLAKLKLRNKIKCRVVLNFFVSVICSCVIWPIYGLNN